MQFEVTMITPEMAKKFLQSNAAFQRKLSRSAVKRLVGVLQRGEWQLTHQGVAFDVNGVLFDGQHRLTAIAESGVSAPMVVFRNVDATVFKVTDIGFKRKLSDQLRIGTREAAIIYRIAINVAGLPSVSSDQAFKVYEEYQPTIDRVLEISGKTRGIFNTGSAWAATVIAAHKTEHSERVLEVYSNIVKDQYDQLPAVANSLVASALKRAIKAGSEADRKDLFLRMLYVYDPSKQGNGSIKLTGEQKSQYLEKEKAVALSLLGDLRESK